MTRHHLHRLTPQEIKKLERRLRREHLYHGQINGKNSHQFERALRAEHRHALKTGHSKHSVESPQYITPYHYHSRHEIQGAASDNRPVSLHPEIDGHTAILDYRTNSVILPNGRQLPVVSGRGVARNNPAYQSVKSIGSIPEGWWTIGNSAIHNFDMRDGTVDQRTGMSLTAAPGTNTYGRTHFVAHEAHGADTNGCAGFSKEGIIAFEEAHRQGVTKLLVTRDARMLGYHVAKLATPFGTPHYYSNYAQRSPTLSAHHVM